MASNNSLINRAHCKKFALRWAQENRRGWAPEHRQNHKGSVVKQMDTTGRKIGQWCTTTELFPKTKYKNCESLRNALRSLRRRDLIEIQRKGKLCHVRLIKDCFGRRRNVDICVSFFDQQSIRP